jgi:hypothetical protein
MECDAVDPCTAQENKYTDYMKKLRANVDIVVPCQILKEKKCNFLFEVWQNNWND